MREPLRAGDIRDTLEEHKEKILRELRESTIRIIEELHKDKSEIIATVFSLSRKIREEIGRQTMMLKMLEDNLSEIQFDEDTGVSSRIELSLGGQIFGTGAKWILDIDTSKASYSRFLKAIQLVPGIRRKIKELAKSKMQKLPQ